MMRALLVLLVILQGAQCLLQSTVNAHDVVQINGNKNMLRVNNDDGGKEDSKQANMDRLVYLQKVIDISPLFHYL